MSNTILIKNCNILKEESFLLRQAYIFIKEGVIDALGPMKELSGGHADTIIDGTHKLVVPGLINGHNHSPMTLFRGMADDLDLPEWLHQYIFPAEAESVNQEMVYWCTKLAAAEMLLSGTTCVADGYFFSGQAAKAFEESGLRAVVAHGILDFPAPGVPDPNKNIETVESYILGWKNKNRRITPAVFAHSPYTCSPETLRKAKQLADDHAVRFFIHIAESREENTLIINPAGPTPLQHLHNLSLLDDNCVLIHAIWLNDEDLDILQSSGAHVILCPQSNYKLASGVSRADDMCRRSIKFGLGTDGCASNNSMDMFREMDLFAKSHKAFHHDPTLFPAEKVFAAATTNNNIILGLDSCNTIHPGGRGDLILIDLNTPHLTPFYNQDLLVYAIRGNDVESVIIDGKIVVHNRNITTFDVEETKNAVIRLAKGLQKRLQ